MTKQEGFALEPEEATTYLQNLIGLMRDCDIREEMVRIHKLMKSQTQEGFVLTINPFTNFPNMGSLVGTNNFLTNQAREYLQSDDFLRRFVTGQISEEDINSKIMSSDTYKEDAYGLETDEVRVHAWISSSKEPKVVLSYFKKTEIYVIGGEDRYKGIAEKLTMISQVAQEELFDTFVRESNKAKFPGEALEQVKVVGRYVDSLKEFIKSSGEQTDLEKKVIETLGKKRALASEAPTFYNLVNTEKAYERLKYLANKNE